MSDHSHKKPWYQSALDHTLHLTALVMLTLIPIAYKLWTTNDQNTAIAVSITFLAIVLIINLLVFSSRFEALDSKIVSSDVIAEWYSDFSICANIVSQAKKSIVVMNHYVDGSNGLSYSNSRDIYMKDGIQKAFQRNKDNNAFRYKRVIPIDNFTSFNGMLTKEIVDEQVIHHYKEMCNEVSHNKQGPGGASFSFVAVRPVSAFPSTLIVDDKYVFFALPVRVSRNEHGAHGYELNDVLMIYDKTSVIPTTFLALIDSFQSDTAAIDGVLDIEKNQRDTVGVIC